MGWFETYPKWEEISKEEYDKARNKTKITKDSSLLEMFESLAHLFDYKEEPIYKEPGLLAMLDPNNIIGYKYYKRVGEETYYLCGSKEYEYLIEKGTVAE